MCRTNEIKTLMISLTQSCLHYLLYRNFNHSSLNSTWDVSMSCRQSHKTSDKSQIYLVFSSIAGVNFLITFSVFILYKKCLHFSCPGSALTVYRPHTASRLCRIKNFLQPPYQIQQGYRSAEVQLIHGYVSIIDLVPNLPLVTRKYHTIGAP